MRAARDCTPTILDCSVVQQPCSMLVARSLGPKKSRKHFVVPLLSGNDVCVPYNTNINELERGVLERLFFVKAAGVFRSPTRPYHDSISKILRPVKSRFSSLTHQATKLTPKQFVENYSGRKRKLYEQAAETLKRLPLDRRDSYMKTFVKYEKHNLTAKPDAVPRIINPRNPRYNVELGRYVKPIEHRIYKIIEEIFDHGTAIVMKGLNQSERGRALIEKWDAMDDPVAIAMDAKRFDQHVSLEALLWEHSIYKMFYRGDKYLSTILKMQLDNRGSGRCSDGFLSYRLLGGRMSGDMNTSLGNVLLMCSMVKAMMTQLGNERFQFANDGDDCVLIVEKPDLKRTLEFIPGFFEKLGFDMVVDSPVYTFEEIDFCQSRPVYDGEDWVMCRNITSISKDAVSLVHWNNPRDACRWMSAVGQCGLSIASGLPIYQSYYECYVRNARGAKAFEDIADYGMAQKVRGMNRVKSTISPLARLSFWKAFGIPPDNQRAIEDHYNQLIFDVDEISTTESLPRPLPW